MQLLWVRGVAVRPATEDDGLHRLGENPVIARLTMHDGEPLEVAVSERDARRVRGPLSPDGHDLA